MRLQRLPAALYAREVLPLTASLWAGRRSLDEYAAQTIELARSTYGPRSYRTMGLYDGGRRVASFKWYERTVQHDSQRLKAVGFGAVFTPVEYRGRGYASLMLASALDLAREHGHDVAYLFSDIRPQFYADLGFSALPSRELTLRAGALPAERLELAPLSREHWRGLRKCFENGRRQTAAAFERSPSVWDWIAMRLAHASAQVCGQATHFIAKRRGEICAYVLGVRAPEKDAFLFDEFGWTERASPGAIAALLRAAAGDLRRVIGWLPPPAARALLPAGLVRRRSRAILMMAPLRAPGRRLIAAVQRSAHGDFCWRTDHI